MSEFCTQSNCQLNARAKYETIRMQNVYHHILYVKKYSQIHFRKMKIESNKDLYNIGLKKIEYKTRQSEKAWEKKN